MKKIAILLTFVLAIFAYSQGSKANFKQRILKGTIKSDEGKLIDCEVEVIDPLGKKFVIKTVDGKFEQVLDAEKDYEFTFVGDNILRESTTVNVAKADKDFTAATETYTVFKLEPGKIIRKLDLFEEGTAKLKSNAKDQLKKLKMMLRFNRSVKIDLVCQGEGGLSKNRSKALTEMTSDDRRFNRSAKISAGSGSDDSKDVLVKIEKVVDRLR